MTRKTQADGQCSVPAEANNSAPVATTKIVFCSKRRAIMRGSQTRARTSVVRLSGKDAAGHAKSPIDRIGRFILWKADQAS
ncbi:hypothetical protein [Bradyrhizobium sp. CCBAU 45389]|uniref:hypothetical protein n=1 Tax=Bradyrhizobium sp. CCBAU 45389 TaxID=858429 RepID=UPI002305D79E|nr:hypothetical protein [Bradyrhizobium sp. CCBAU 45389]